MSAFPSVPMADRLWLAGLSRNAKKKKKIAKCRVSECRSRSQHVQTVTIPFSEVYALSNTLVLINEERKRCQHTGSWGRLQRSAFCTCDGRYAFRQVSFFHNEHGKKKRGKDVGDNFRLVVKHNRVEGCVFLALFDMLSATGRNRR